MVTPQIMKRSYTILGPGNPTRALVGLHSPHQLNYP